MELLHSEYKDRIAHWQRVLAQDFYHPAGEIAFEGFTTMDHLTPEQAADGGFRHPSCRVGQRAASLYQR